MADYQEFAARFNAAVALLNFKTQKALADALGITPGYLSELLSGKKFPSETLLLLMEAKFGLNTAYLKEGAEPKFLKGREPGKGAEPGAGAQEYDTGLMTEIIETLEELFAEKSLSLPPKKKAQLIELLYQELSEDRGDAEKLKGKILKFTRLAS